GNARRALRQRDGSKYQGGDHAESIASSHGVRLGKMRRPRRMSMMLAARLMPAMPPKTSSHALTRAAPPPASRSAPKITGPARPPANPKKEYTAIAVPRADGAAASTRPAVKAAESGMIAST